MVRVKICGITTPGDALFCAEFGADAIGLNFYPKSPRAVSPFAAEKIIRNLPPFVATVGIFVNWVPEAVVALCQALGLHYAQLHGDETPQVVAEVARRIPVIKALRVGHSGSLPALSGYAGVAAFLLDSASGEKFGGSGQPTNWAAARKAAASHRVILAGGLTPENVAAAIATVRPYGVDVASGVESRPDKKDPKKLRAFFQAVRNSEENK